MVNKVDTQSEHSKVTEAFENNDFKSFAEFVVGDKELASEFMETVLISEHFPIIANGMLDTIKDLVNSNKESTNHVYENIKNSCDILGKIVDEQGDKMDKEERKEIIDKIMELNQKAIELDGKNKKFLFAFGALTLAALGITGGLLINKKLDNDLIKTLANEAKNVTIGATKDKLIK